MNFDLESAEEAWATFWEAIDADGDFDASLAEWQVTHNAMPPKKSFVERAVRKAISLPQQMLG
jgi:hypothetical protein